MRWAGFLLHPGRGGDDEVGESGRLLAFFQIVVAVAERAGLGDAAGRAVTVCAARLGGERDVGGLPAEVDGVTFPAADVQMFRVVETSANQPAVRGCGWDDDGVGIGGCGDGVAVGATGVVRSGAEISREGGGLF